MSGTDWVLGDRFGLEIPASPQALRDGGAAFLSRAFQLAGTLAADNRVARITRFEECRGGSTGRKLMLYVEYEKPAAALHRELFVKFSRDFDDPIRDRARDQLEPEVRLALLSRSAAFPIAVPACLFADYQQASGTGLLITQRIAFGRDGIESPYEKCGDHAMPEPLAHYRVLLRALARLAGAHRGGDLGAVAQQFPFDADRAAASDRIRYNPAQLLRRVDRYAEFAARYPQLLPAHIRTAEFIAQLTRDIPRLLQHEAAIKRLLYGKSEYIALCHWNANVDNAWFWRDVCGELHCGLMDWGRVSQMNIAMAIFGCLIAAELELWDTQLDALLVLFASEFHSCGGARVDIEELKIHLLLYAAMMGLAWLMDAPQLILAQLPDLDRNASRLDPRIRHNETARVQLHMLTTVLHLWQTRDFGRLLDGFVERH